MTTPRDLLAPLLGPVQTAAERIARAEAMALLRSCACGIDREDCRAECDRDGSSAPHDARLERTCPCCRRHHDLAGVEIGAAVECSCGAHLFRGVHELEMAEEGECGECDQLIRYAPSADLATLTCPHCGELAALTCGTCSDVVIRPVGSDDACPPCGAADREMRRRDEIELAYGVDHYADADEDGTWSGREVVL